MRKRKEEIERRKDEEGKSTKWRKGSIDTRAGRPRNGSSRRTRLSRPEGGGGDVLYFRGLHLEEPVERLSTEYGGASGGTDYRGRERPTRNRRVDATEGITSHSYHSRLAAVFPDADRLVEERHKIHFKNFVYSPIGIKVKEERGPGSSFFFSSRPPRGAFDLVDRYKPFKEKHEISETLYEAVPTQPLVAFFRLFARKTGSRAP